MKPESPVQKVTELGVNYRAQLVKLGEHATAIALAYKLCAQRPWMMPDPGPNNWPQDLLDILEIGVAFERIQNNGDYVTAMSETPRGVLSDTIVSKAQVDYLAAQERSFRMRHLSAPRAALHAAGRRRGQGHDNGLFTKVLPNYLMRLIAAGANPAPAHADD